MNPSAMRPPRLSAICGRFLEVVGIGPRICPDQFGFPGLESAAKSSPGVGMLMESFRIAFAIWSAGRRAGSAPISVQQTNTKAAPARRVQRFIGQRTHAPADCQWES